MSKKLGLVLGAGGSRGVAHIGVIRALEEEGIKPSLITGCSIGSVVGACYAKGMTCDEMLETAYKIKAGNLIDPAAVPIKKLGFFKGDKMHELLLENIGDITFEQLEIPFCCVASDMLSGRSVTLCEGKVTDAVRASSSIPALFRPVKLDGKMLIDGGVLCRVPTEQAWEMGAEAVLAIDVLGNTGDSVSSIRNIVSMVFRIYDMMDYNATQIKKQLTKRKGELWLTPQIEDMSQYVVKDLDRAYEQGYAITRANMSAIKKLIK